MQSMICFDSENNINEEDEIIAYHGAGMIIEKPEVRIGKYTKDFGHGFYATNIVKQSERWANNRRNKNHVVNIYYVDKSYVELNNKVFVTMTEEWLDFIIDCRKGKTHNYDRVEGPMCDHTIFNYVTDVINKVMEREVFWGLCKCKYPTHQLVFNTERSLAYLRFKEAYHV